MRDKLVPELRFKEFEGEWELKTAGHYFTNRSEKGNDTLPVLSVTQSSSRIIRRDSLDRDFNNAAKSSSNKQVYPDDLAYNTMRMWQGAVAIADEHGMLSAAYTVLNPNEGTDSEYFNYLFRTNPALYKLWAYPYGLTSDRLRLYFKDFAMIPFRIPTLLEQQKIATFLNLVDRRLTAARRQVELLEKWRREVLQRLYEDRNLAVWPKISLRKFGKFTGGGTPSKMVDEYWNGDKPWISSSDVTDNSINTPDISRYISDLAVENSPVNLVPENSILFVSRVGVGKLAVNEKPLYTSQDFTNMSTDQNSYFIAYYFLKNWKKLHSIAQGSTIKGFTVNDLKSLKISLPPLEEQTRIATILNTIDTRITAARAEVAGWEAWKRGLLQGMLA